MNSVLKILFGALAVAVSILGVKKTLVKEVDFKTLDEKVAGPIPCPEREKSHEDTAKENAYI